MSTIGAQYRPLREVVAEEIRGMILRGELGAGDRLLEDRLADQLGVSRNPVREAIRSLEATGLVQVIPRRGAYVTKVDVDDLRDLLEIRRVLEGYAAEVLARSPDPDVVAALSRFVDEGRAASSAGNHVRAAECHRGFHLAIERAVGNPYLEQVIQPLRQRTEILFSILVEARGGLTWQEHERILDAIAAGDPDQARATVDHHLESVIQGVERTRGAQRG